MIVIVLFFCALCVLCIAMSCVALRYRRKWLFEWGLRRDLQEEWRATDNALLDAQTQVEELLKENRELRSQLPKRDSKGRFCKRKEKSMSKWTNAAELSVWQGAKVEDCCGNCLECEHCASIEVDGKEIMVLCEAQD